MAAVGRNLHELDDVSSFILWTRARTNCAGNCLVDDIQDNTIWESLRYMTSHLVFVSCSVLVRYPDNCAPKSAANMYYYTLNSLSLFRLAESVQ